MTKPAVDTTTLQMGVHQLGQHAGTQHALHSGLPCDRRAGLLDLCQKSLQWHIGGLPDLKQSLQQEPGVGLKFVWVNQTFTKR